MDILIAISCILLGVWLFFGILAYGSIFAYMQRHFSPHDARKDLYLDMKMGLKFIPQGFFGLVKVTEYLTEHEAWDFNEAAPLYGLKFLPRHESRS